MTALARQISETPMAPYVDLLRNMVKDNHTLRRGLLYRYTAMAFPQP